MSSHFVAPASVRDVTEILAMLPHRYPLLLVDRIASLGAERIVAWKQVSFNEPHFQGHFPGEPVMPGVLIIEALAQAGGILALSELKKQPGFDAAGKLLFFMGIDKAKFRKKVVPGDALRLEAVPLRRGSTVWKLKGQAFVDDQLVCEAEFLASIADRS